MLFTKMHGAGNDFVVLDGHSNDHDWAILARRMCDRHFGIGADGVILALPSAKAQLRMGIFNPDGSEAEMCGNGIRCLTKYVFDRGLCPLLTNNGLTIETLAGVLSVFPTFDNNNNIVGVKVNMGCPILVPAEIPVDFQDKDYPLEGPVLDYPLEVAATTVSLAFVSMGNPHAVAIMDTSVDEFPLLDLGPRIEHHPIFPRRTNFEAVNVIDRQHLIVKVWERGAGPTLACGSGACASVVAAHLKGLVDNKVDATLPGGTLSIEWTGQGPIWMAGPVETVFEGEWTTE